MAYSFPERSRAGMIRAIERIASPYYERRSGRFLFSWNVKLGFLVDDSAKGLAPYAESPLDPALDDAWSAALESDSWRWGCIAEDMGRDVEDYCTYPGNDQGQFSFGFYGRCGGNLCLESAFGQDMTGDIDDFTAMLADKEETPFSDLRRLYRAIVCMDSDFSRAKVRESYCHHLAFMRQSWEEERREERAAYSAAFAAELEASRPDMYGVAA